MAKAARQLGDLISIGPATLRDFELLGFAAWHSWRGRTRGSCTRSWGAWPGSIRISACWTCFARRWRRRGIRGWMRRSANGGGGANKGNNEVME